MNPDRSEFKTMGYLSTQGQAVKGGFFCGKCKTRLVDRPGPTGISYGLCPNCGWRKP